jgi:hypothetical protein
MAFKEYSNANAGTVHMTIIFNIFVFYTLFNQINCRVLDDSFNILKRIHRSFLFIIITFCEMGLQVLMIFVGNAVFHVSFNGITGIQWGICIGFSAITFVVSFIAKLIPLEKLIDKCLVKNEEDDNNGNNNDDNSQDNNEELNIIMDNESNNKLKIKEKNRITRNKNVNMNSSERNMNTKIMSFKKERDDKDHLKISQTGH